MPVNTGIIENSICMVQVWSLVRYFISKTNPSQHHVQSQGKFKQEPAGVSLMISSVARHSTHTRILRWKKLSEGASSDSAS